MPYSVYCPTRIIFSDDAAADLTREAQAYPPGPALLVTDTGLLAAGLAEPVLKALRLAGREPAVFSAIPTNPGFAAVRAALEEARKASPALIVALGGGSPIDVAKALGILLAHDSDDWESFQWNRTPITRGSLPVIAIPTTAGTGSEVSHVAVIGDSAGFKKGLVHPALFARAAIVDGGLMRGLPPALTAATGLDALTHALEAFLARRNNPSMDLLALGALRRLAHWLPRGVADGQNLEARRELAQASTWAGQAMDQAGLGLCHALCGPLTSVSGVHHGLGNALLLPAVLDFNAPAIAPDRWPALRDALGLSEAARPEHLGEWQRAFNAGLGLPAGLRSLELKQSDLPGMAETAQHMAMLANNIRSAGMAECQAVLEAAW